MISRFTNVNEEECLYGVAGSSGDYAETTFRYAAKTLFGKELSGPLEFKTIRNSDFQEVTLEVSLYFFFDANQILGIYEFFFIKLNILLGTVSGALGIIN